jgi:protein-tyrosine phosphatase
VLTTVHWINKNLGIMPRPRGGDWVVDEIRSLHDQGVDMLVSLLTADEVREFELAEEELASRGSGLEFLSIPIQDRSVPDDQSHIVPLLQKLDERVESGTCVVFHFRAGIGRASLMAAALMVRAGLTVADAFSTIAAARGCSVPDTEEQLRWLERISTMLLRRG